MPKMTTEKSFDAVEWMREARRLLNAELEGKSFEEQKKYIREHLAARRPNTRTDPR